MILFLQSYEKELKHGCYIHFRAAIICSFADISVPLQPRVGPIVQWIERRFPKPLIWVRFPVGVHRRDGDGHDAGQTYTEEYACPALLILRHAPYRAAAHGRVSAGHAAALRLYTQQWFDSTTAWLRPHGSTSAAAVP